MFNYDIVPIGLYTDNPRYVAKRVRRGTGRYHTLYQAQRLASDLRGYERNTSAFRSRNIGRNSSIGERMTQRVIQKAIRDALKKRDANVE